MLQLIVKNDYDFNILSKYATYSSKLTRVVEIDEDKVPNDVKFILLKYESNVDSQEEFNDPIVKAFGDKDKQELYLENSNFHLSVYLGLDKTNKITKDSFPYLLEAKELGLINFDYDVENFILPKNLKDLSTVEELYCNKWHSIHRHKKWTFDKNFSTIQDLKINNLSETTYKKLSNLICFKHDDIRNLYYCSSNGQNYVLQFFGFIHPGFRWLLLNNKEFNIIYKSEKLLNGTHFITEPELVPQNFPDQITRYSLNNRRDIPAKLQPSVVAEVRYRKQ